MDEGNESAPFVEKKDDDIPRSLSGLGQNVDMTNIFEWLDQYKGSKSSISICCSIYNIAFLASIVAVLATDDGECGTPIRLWMLVYAIICGVGLVTQAIGEFALNLKTILQSTGCVVALILFFALYSLFVFVWFILGNIWLFGDNDCQENFENGYIICLVILLTTYVHLGMLLTVLGCCCCCGMLVSNIFNMGSGENYEQVQRN